MEQKIVYTEEVEYFLNDLVDILFKKHYFSYKENAREYVDEIIEAIEERIYFLKHYKTPDPLLNHGKYYVSVILSRRTAWYIFFDKKDTRYLITNNHVAKAAFLKGL
jgi:hypothetical protein